MGRNKMLLELEGESLVRRAARRALAAGLAPVVVVIGHEADRVRTELKDLPLEFAVNPDFTGPTSGSLHQGLNRLGPDVDAVVVMLGDMRRLRPARRRSCSGGRSSPSCSPGRGRAVARPWCRRTATKRCTWTARSRCSRT